MLKAFYELLDRLDRAQAGLIFRIVATLLGIAVVGAACGMTLAGNAGFLPEAYRENIISSSIIAALVVTGIVWLNRTLTALGFAGTGLTVVLLLHYVFNHPTWAQMALGVTGLAILFTVLLQLLRLVFDLPWRPLAVARLVIDEAIRLKLALIFIVAVIVFIPVLAATLDPAEALRYRIQTFLSYGTGLSYGMLAVMTLFLSTATVAFEQRDKTIFQVISKPISHFEYLLGKWIGVMGLNLVLLLLVSGSIFWFVQYLRVLPAQDLYDRLAVTEQVLTARVGVKPWIEIDQRGIARKVDEDIKRSSEIEDTIEARQREYTRLYAEARTRALTINPGEFKEFTFKDIRPLRRKITRNVSPGDTITLSDPVKTFMDIEVWDEAMEKEFAPGEHFEPLNVGQDDTDAGIYFYPADQQKTAGTGIAPNQRVVIRYFPSNALTLRFKINSGNNDPGVHFPLSIAVANTPFVEVRQVALIQSQTMLIPAGSVDADGTLTIAIINGDINTKKGIPAAITFPPDGLEIMYKVSSFEPNYLRAMLIDWLKLGFLAMLGIAAATFASFPVACLLAFGIYFGAQTSPFLAESIEYYRVTNVQTQEVIWIKFIISKIATAAHSVLQGFEQVRPTERLIEGRNIPWIDVRSVFLTITIVWTGLAGLVGWIIFRSRQLAIYSGNS